MKKFMLCLVAVLLVAFSSISLMGCGKEKTLEGAYVFEEAYSGNTYKITIYFYENGEAYFVYEDDSALDEEAEKYDYKILEKNKYIVFTDSDGDSFIWEYECINRKHLVLEGATFVKQK